ncbi:MAG: ABC transporter permease [Clostridiales Family XIII bacterium]|jgi:osmoprotectant transport system permease protein|nr:ABC transporter permease [Clostridiales Family XIII bacterium]
MLSFNEVIRKLLEHIELSFISLFFAFIIGFSFSIFFYKSKFFSGFFINIFSALRIIPSLAILFFCIIFLSPGKLPAIIALTVLGIPPILINAITGFKNIEPFMLEVAKGLGMGKKESFFSVKLPLSFPYLLSGIKTSTIELIASASLASYIGGGGLGDIIFTGLGLMRYDLLVVGGGLTALLAIFFDTSLSVFEKRLLRYS